MKICTNHSHYNQLVMITKRAVRVYIHLVDNVHLTLKYSAWALAKYVDWSFASMLNILVSYYYVDQLK